MVGFPFCAAASGGLPRAGERGPAGKAEPARRSLSIRCLRDRPRAHRPPLQRYSRDRVPRERREAHQEEGQEAELIHPRTVVTLLSCWALPRAKVTSPGSHQTDRFVGRDRCGIRDLDSSTANPEKTDDLVGDTQVLPGKASFLEQAGLTEEVGEADTLQLAESGQLHHVEPPSPPARGGARCWSWTSSVTSTPCHSMRSSLGPT